MSARDARTVAAELLALAESVSSLCDESRWYVNPSDQPEARFDVTTRPSLGMAWQIAAVYTDIDEDESGEQHAKFIAAANPESIALVCRAYLEGAQDREDAERWRKVRNGLFVTPHPGPEVEVVFQNGWLDEFAQQLYPALEKDSRGIAFDITTVVDAAIARAATTEDTRR